MIIDSIITISAILAFYRGWKKGIVSAILSLVGVILGTILSLSLSHTVAQYLQNANILNTQYMLPIAFIVIFVGVILLVRFVIKMIEGVLKMAMLGWANKLIGAGLYVLFTLFFVSSVIWLGNSIGVFTATAKQQSKTYPFVEPIAPKTIAVVSPFIPYCKNILLQIKDLAQKIPGNQ